MMALDMTAQLAPLVWGINAILILSAIGIVVAALRGKRAEGVERRADRQALPEVPGPGTTVVATSAAHEPEWPEAA